MARDQGSANLYQKGRLLLAATVCGATGGRTDARGVWTGLTFVDLDRYCSLVEWDVADDLLGGEARRALQAAEYGVPYPAAWESGIDSDKAEQNARMARAFGAASVGSLFSGMRCCVVDHMLGALYLEPTRRRRGGYFDAFDDTSGPDHEEIAISAVSSDADFGAAIRRCFERCL